MEFRRITGLPPYVFAIINELKIDARRAGRDVVDLGFGNPDLASPPVAVDKMVEAVQNSRNHRYSPSRGLPKLRQGDTALVPSPSYPIHIWGPLFAGANITEVPLGTGDDFFAAMEEAWEYAWPKPRVAVLSFPHNPTTTCVDLEFFAKTVEFAREREVLLVHDHAYADLGFDGYDPPSILQVPGAKDVAVELYSMTKSFSMAGWRVAFLVGNPEVVGAL